ncbi:MAG TPA: PaaX family transcriptional regulator C-terminal domain-containing protein [Pseudonocardia sp.]|jgi:phenylacetic acid degradation operon negative regulatory protein
MVMRESLAEHLGIAPLAARSVALSALLGSHPPQLPARALVAMGSLFGVAEGAMRTALSRMALAGEVVLSDAEYVLGERLRRRQAWQDATRRMDTEQWDGAWWCAMVSAERRSGGVRRTFRALMAEHRMAELRPEVWLRPANIDGPAPGEGVLVMRGPITGPAGVELAGQLWDLPALAADADELTALAGEALSWLAREDPSAMADAFLVSIAAVRYLRVEPLLPIALVGPGWPADRLREAYDELEKAYAIRMSSFLAAAS